MNSFLNYESLAKKKDIDYNFYSELQDEDVLFDGTYLDLIINNLLSNAFKYTEEGERIYVKLYREDKNVVLQVADTGVGIPKDKQRKIFERFIRWRMYTKEAASDCRWFSVWLNCITADNVGERGWKRLYVFHLYSSG